jgi:hypothetical protein
MKPIVSMRVALNDPDRLGGILQGESWRPWRILLIAVMGEPLLDAELAIFKELTGRDYEQGLTVEEFWAIVGRRSGKTRAVAVLAVYLAILCDYSGLLVIGERGLVAVLSASVWQAQRAFQYISGIVANVPAFKRLVSNETADTISLTNGVDIECRPASFRTIRGATAVAIIADEICFWRSDETSRNPDSEILAAVRPALATTGGPLICISSPYGKRGEAWNVFRRDFGLDGDPRILVANAASRVMNPTLNERVVERAYERDPQAAAAEYGGQFRNDISGFLDFALIDAAVDRGVLVRPPRSGVRYRAAADPSGGASDSFSLAICHNEGDTAVVDCLVEIRSPFNPTSATAQMAATLKEYGLSDVTGDRYSAAWVVDAFSKVGITYRHSERDRSAAYLEALPLFTAGNVRLIDNSRLVAQFAALERRTSAVGKDRVDHGPGGHDDLCNAVALALTSVVHGYDASLRWVGNWDDAKDLIKLYHLTGQGPRRWYG